MYAASSMCVAMTGVEGLSIARIGRTSTSGRPRQSNPTGVWIHAFAATTKIALAAPQIATGHPTTNAPTARAGPIRTGRSQEDRLDEEGEGLERERQADHASPIGPSARARTGRARTTARCR